MAQNNYSGRSSQPSRRTPEEETNQAAIIAIHDQQRALQLAMLQAGHVPLGFGTDRIITGAVGNMAPQVGMVQMRPEIAEHRNLAQLAMASSLADLVVTHPGHERQREQVALQALPYHHLALGSAMRSPILRNYNQVTQAQKKPDIVQTPTSAIEGQKCQSAMRMMKRLDLFLFIRVLLKYLEKENPDLRIRCTKVIRSCKEKQKQGDPSCASLAVAIRTTLKKTVGEKHWVAATACYRRIIEERNKGKRGKHGGGKSMPQHRD